ncbi:unnamed protein product [Phaedon cochleariae]|uniref:C2H2-type domain-containing protein n=1 Tax=Phaedon cochleariae TaxID=80249 RepID=A0A9P0GRS9_PHACE|nr:unnamed protein product [Phaedon cochleariae]
MNAKSARNNLGDLTSRSIPLTGDRPLEVTIRNKTSRFKHHNIRHRKMHDKVIHYECDFCNIRCISNLHLTNHIKIHTDEKPFGCDVCKKHFWTRQTLKKHSTLHNADKCYFCDRRFQSKSLLDKHVTSTHSSETPFECNICYKEFRSKNHLMQHSKTHDKEILLECTICHNMRWSSKSHLPTQNMDHADEKPFKCDICTQQSLTKKVHRILQSVKKPFECNICNRKFCNEHHFIRHRATHDEDKYYECDMCHTWCVSKNHVKAQTNGKPFRCDPCKELFWAKQNLKNHSKLETGMKPECDFCHKILHSIPLLRRHITVMHTSETPFECNICYKEFRSKNHFMQHRKAHDEQISSGCDICHDMRYQNIVHSNETPFKCSICNKQFRTIRNLRAHDDLHRGKKTFECSICNKKFPTKSNLNRHSRLHRGEKLIECSVCTKDNLAKVDMENPPECVNYSRTASFREEIQFPSDDSDEKCSYNTETELDKYIIDEEPCKINIENEDSQSGREQQRLEFKREDSDDSCVSFVTPLKVDIDEIMPGTDYEIKTE